MATVPARPELGFIARLSAWLSSGRPAPARTHRRFEVRLNVAPDDELVWAEASPTSLSRRLHHPGVVGYLVVTLDPGSMNPRIVHAYSLECDADGALSLR